MAKFRKRFSAQLCSVPPHVTRYACSSPAPSPWDFTGSWTHRWGPLAVESLQATFAALRLPSIPQDANAPSAPLARLFAFLRSERKAADMPVKFLLQGDTAAQDPAFLALMVCHCNPGTVGSRAHLCVRAPRLRTERSSRWLTPNFCLSSLRT